MLLLCNPFCPTYQEKTLLGEKVKQGALEVVVCHDDENEADEIPQIKKAVSFSPTIATCMSSLYESSSTFDDSNSTIGIQQIKIDIPVQEIEYQMYGIEAVASFSPTTDSTSALEESEEESDGEAKDLIETNRSSIFKIFSFKNSSLEFEKQKQKRILSSHLDEDDLVNCQQIQAELIRQCTVGSVSINKFDEEEAKRLSLVQGELDEIILTCLLQNYNVDEIDIEDEAVEALGIAANKLCHLLGSINEQTSGPSVAYSMLYGNLLQNASEHYVGDANDFILRYGSMMLSAAGEQEHMVKMLQRDNNNNTAMVELD